MILTLLRWMFGRLEMKVMLDEGAYMPERAHSTDAGYDIKSPVSVVIPARGSVLIKTGVHIELPRGGRRIGLYARIASKSGLNTKYDIISEGVVDEGYTGEICVRLHNLSDRDYSVLAGDKITQMIVELCFKPKTVVAHEIKASERGSNGFGSTGR